MHAYTSHVHPSLNGRFMAIIRDADRSIVAQTIPTSDRNQAARDGQSVRSAVARGA